MHFPACSLSSHVRMCTCLHLRAILVCRPASRVYVSVCMSVRVCVCVPGEPMAGQRFSPDQGYTGGGDADDRQPLRFCLPPLFLSSTHLQRLQGPPTRGTTVNTPEYTHVCKTHTLIHTEIASDIKMYFCGLNLQEKQSHRHPFFYLKSTLP